MIQRAFHVSLSVALALTLAAATANAGLTKRACAKANADGQASRLDGKLSDARASLQACVDPSCPSIVRDDCAERLAELDRAQPTIVFDVKDGSGNDVGAVAVLVDGKPLAETPTGLALRIDPGEHTFTFTANGMPPLTRRFVLKEGEKDRRERITIGPLPPAPAVVTTVHEPARGLETKRIVGIAAAGLGVVGVAVGTIFGVQTFAAVSDQKSDCASSSQCVSPGKAQADHSTASTDGAVSTGAFIAAGALLAAGAYLFFSAPHASAPATTGLVVVPSVGPGGGGLSLRAEF